MNKKLAGLESFDSGSNYKFGDKMESPKCPRSLFDLTHLNSLTIKNAGIMVPLTYWETLPGDDFDISIDTLLRVMPQVVPLYSRQRLYVYGFYSPYATLWNNWQVFMDKGFTGNVTKTIPILKHGNNIDPLVNFPTIPIPPDSFGDYMGLPINMDPTKLFGSSSDPTNNAHLSALPFMMYLRIYRDYFMNKNHYINDRVLLPDDDSRFRLDDNGVLLSASDQGKSFYFNLTNVSTYGVTYDNNLGKYNFNLFVHDFPDDYFTSALPFTQRGTATPLNASATGLSANTVLDFSNSKFFNSVLPGQAQQILAGATDSNPGPFAPATGLSTANDLNSKMIMELNKGIASTSISGTATLSIFLEDIRKLAIQQQELERLARTDGSYLEFGLTFFGEKPRNAYDYRPIYIGGTYKNLAFTEVLQTAGSTVGAAQTTGSTDSPLGAYAGHGITGISNGRIGHIHCDDYGLIMIVACVMPDVYYSQGLDRVLTDSLQSEKYLPERALLGLQPILNKELYYAGNNGNSLGDDNYLWAYQNPFDWLRYMPNKIHGKIADSTNNSFFPYTQSRKFTSLPNWGPAFANASPSNVRKDYLFAPSEDAYSAQFKFNIRAVRPLPYKATPAQLVHY